MPMSASPDVRRAAIRLELTTTHPGRTVASPLGPQVVGGGTLANFSTVLGPFCDRFAEVEANEDARIRILGRCLGEASTAAQSL
jgi:hypothetical protein